MSSRDKLCHRLLEMVRAGMDQVPLMSLRGGEAEDNYRDVPPYDKEIDRPTNEYLEKYAYWGLPHLDAVSWRYYLPLLMNYALRHMRGKPRGSMVVEGLLGSLRPPDREPPRLGSLKPEEEGLVRSFLEELAFSDDSKHQDLATQVLNEWWTEDSFYRPRGGRSPTDHG